MLYNALFGHAQTCLTELPCKYCGTQIRGHQKQLEHEQLCKEEQLTCEKCGHKYKRDAKETHVCPELDP